MGQTTTEEVVTTQATAPAVASQAPAEEAPAPAAEPAAAPASAPATEPAAEQEGNFFSRIWNSVTDFFTNSEGQFLRNEEGELAWGRGLLVAAGGFLGLRLIGGIVGGLFGGGGPVGDAVNTLQQDAGANLQQGIVNAGRDALGMGADPVPGEQTPPPTPGGPADAGRGASR